MASNDYIGDAFNAVASSAVSVHLERCAKVRNRNVSCLRCAEVCTSGCLSIEDGCLKIDASKCVGCGTCASVCPTCALESRNPCDAELVQSCSAKVKNDELYIACVPYLDALRGMLHEDACAQVVCLGRVEESLLATMASRGVRRIHLLCGDCSHCKQRYGCHAAYAACVSVRSLLAAWGVLLDVNVEPGVAPTLLAEGVEVRDAQQALNQVFAAGAACQPLHVAGSECVSGEPKEFRLQHVMDDGTLPHFLPDRREALLDALAALGEPQNRQVSSRLWGAVVIDGNKCVSCRMCATFCPTGAISKFDCPDGTFGIEHFPADCVKCGSCRDICPAQAITIRDRVPVEYLLGSEVHRYPMRERDVPYDTVHQIKNTVARYIEGDVFER